jgi:hypothetical protein
MRKLYFLFPFLVGVSTCHSLPLHAQVFKPKWMQVQEENIMALQEYHALLLLKDSLQLATNDSLTLNLQREPCDICSKWDLSLTDKQHNYKAFYVIKMNKHNNKVQEIIPLKIRKTN